MNNKLKMLPCGSPEEIVESIFRGDRFSPEINEVLDRDFDPVSFLEDQDEWDGLAEVCYPDMVFPLMGNNNRAEPLSARLSEQTSRYHKETTAQHICLVVYGVAQKTSDRRLLLAALLHDFAKKWDTGTNKRREICFYDHEKLSAYFAANVLKQMGLSREEVFDITAIIHGHMLPFNVWPRIEGSEDDFRRTYGNFVADGVKTLNSCDKGCLTKEEVAEHETVFEAGRKIIETL